jgi:hypothetical protein
MKHLRSIINIWIFVCCSAFSFGQDSLGYSWSQVGELNIGQESFYTVDNLNNIYYTKDQSLVKVDSVFELKFKQSIKSLGDPRQLTAVNSMKLVHFSWQQQTLCFFDNTLTQSEDCIDLFDVGLNNVTQIASSQRPNRLWVFDEVNSVLTLLNTDDVSASVQLINLSGVLEIDSCTRIMERNNKLFLLDKNNGVYIFDQFGTLLERISFSDIEAIEVYEQNLLLLQKETLISYDLRTGEEFTILLPIRDVSSLVAREDFFYFRKGEIVHKFRLQL